MKTKKPIKKSAPKKAAPKKNLIRTKKDLQEHVEDLNKLILKQKKETELLLAQKNDLEQKYTNANTDYQNKAVESDKHKTARDFFAKRISDNEIVIEAYKDTAIEFASNYTQQMNEAIKLDHENRKLTVAIDVLMNLKSAESVMGTACQLQSDPEFEVENVFNRKYKKHKKPDFADGGPITNRTNEERSAFGLTAKDSIQLAADAMKKLHDFLGGDKTK